MKGKQCSCSFTIQERLHRLQQTNSAQCTERDGVENTTHLFCLCTRVQEAWAWMRRKIRSKNLALPGASDFDLIHLNSGIDTKVCDLVWLISQYILYVWNLKKSKANYFVNLNFLQAHLEQKLVENQASQNKVSPYILN